jgi:hypothetical protein
LHSNLFNSSSERLTNTSTTTTSASTNNTKTNFNGDYIGHLLFYLSSALSC